MRKSALALLLVVACSQEKASAPLAAETSAAATEAASAPSGPIDFSEADLDLYERGIAKEIELVKAARERGANAATPGERAAAAQAEWEDSTIPAAAQAAGIDADRYRHTREAVHNVLD